MSAAGSLSGTSHAGRDEAKRPFELSSKISLSYGRRASGIVRASRHRRGQRAAVAVDLLARPLLGDGDEQTVLVVPIQRLERQAAEDSILDEASHHSLRRLGELERELLEERRGETHTDAGDLAEFRRGVVRLGERELAHAAKP